MFQTFTHRLLFMLIGVLIVSQVVIARPLTKEEKFRDFEQLISIMKANYAPLEYKVSQGIDLDAIRFEYLVKIDLSRSNNEFYYLLNQFIAEFNDSHFRGRIPTDYGSHLGFFVDLVDGRVLIDEINRNFLPIRIFPFVKGDELVSMNGLAIADIIAELESYVAAGNPVSAKRIATQLSTFRPGAFVPVVEGPADLVFIRAGEEILIQLNWFVFGTKIIDDERMAAKPGFKTKSLRNTQGFLDFKLSIKDRMDEIRFGDIERSYSCNGSTRVAIPENVTVIMTSPFVAYYHPHPEDPSINVGYLRIPHYAPSIDQLGEIDPFQARFDQYEYAVSILEENTEGLIIDQDHNCGGSVFYLHQLASLFTADDVDQIEFNFLATRPETRIFADLLESLDPSTIFYHEISKVVDLIRSTWDIGETRLTSKTGLFGEFVFPRHHISYSKPIVMLIDEMAGSGGDAFPALLGGSGRATLLGQRTMGAGGHVESGTPLFFSGYDMTVTKSLFYRPDGVAVENNGVEPHIEYIPTVNDFINQYSDYQNFYLEKLLGIIKGQVMDKPLNVPQDIARPRPETWSRAG